MSLAAVLVNDLAVLAGDFALAYDSLGSILASAGEGLRSRLRATEVDIAEGSSAVALAAPDWHAVEAHGGAATPFQRLAVAQAAVPVHLSRGERPRIVIVRDEGRAVVILPTVVAAMAGRPVIRFLGDPLIQYGDLLAAPDAEPKHLEAAWRAVADPAVAGAAYLRKVRADARIAPLLARHARVVSEAAAPFVDLRTETTQHDGRRIRRFRRRLAGHGSVRLTLLDGEAAQPALRQALSLKRGWLAARGLGSPVIGDPAWESALMALAGGRGTVLSAACLEVAGRTAAIEIGFRHGQRWYSYLGAIAPEFAKAGPGHVQIMAMIDRCRADGLISYDLMAPADDYKRALTDAAVTVRDHAIALRPSGRLSLLTARLAPHVKRVVAAMPPAARRAALAWIRR